MSRLKEDRTVLGAYFSPAFASGGAKTTFLDGSAGLDFGRGWGAFASYRLGWTSLSGTQGMVDKGRLLSNAFAVDLSRTGLLRAGDRFAVRVMQPLRVVRGGLEIPCPRPMIIDRRNRFDQRFMSLAPRP